MDVPGLTTGVNELTTLLHTVQDPEYLVRFKTQSERLKPLKDMLYWFPSRFLPKLNSHPSVMILMVHLCACALFLEPVEDSDSAYFRRMNASPIRSSHEEFPVRAGLGAENG